MTVVPKIQKARARRIVQGLVEEARFGVPFSQSRLLEELLAGDFRIHRLVAELLGADPGVAEAVLHLDGLDPVWRQAAEKAIAADPRVPLDSSWVEMARA